MTEAIFALLGVVLGFVLSEGARLIREKGQQQRIQFLLQKEVDYNLALLREYWSKINSLGVLKDLASPVNDEELQLRNYTLTKIVRGMEPPMWSRVIWESQLPFLPGILNRKELDKLQSLYHNLDMISRKQATLRKESKTSDPLMTDRELGKQIEELVTHILRRH